ncbi:cation diffusion facilitator family transporter [bacterium]|nr:cation diffusion facilitator family transporter [bacterium]
MMASLGVAVLMLAGKVGAYLLTNSTAILSDAAESVIHIVATGVVGYCLWYSARPADQDHPYGHGKIAYFSAGFEGAMIFMAALAILFTAIKAIIVGPELHSLDWGLAIIAALALVNLILGLSLVHYGKKTHSMVLVANGRHVLTDVWTSAAVVVGVALVYFTEIAILDPIVAILAALHILGSGLSMARDAYHGLMEKASPEDSDRLIHCLRKAVDEKLISGFHAVRHRRVNDALWVEVHFLLPGNLSMMQAHAQASKVEDAIHHAYEGEQVYVTAHLEPDDHTAAHPTGEIAPPDALEAYASVHELSDGI